MKFDLKSPVTTIEFDNQMVVPRIIEPHLSGKLVAVRPVALINPEDKTFLGLILGDLHVAAGILVKNEVATITSHLKNPAIFVFELKQIIYGMECWWKLISSKEMLDPITEGELSLWSAQIDEQIAWMDERRAEILKED